MFRSAITRTADFIVSVFHDIPRWLRHELINAIKRSGHDFIEVQTVTTVQN